jgi:hypothetical protein
MQSLQALYPYLSPNKKISAEQQVQAGPDSFAFKYYKDIVGRTLGTSSFKINGRKAKVWLRSKISAYNTRDKTWSPSVKDDAGEADMVLEDNIWKFDKYKYDGSYITTPVPSFHG